MSLQSFRNLSCTLFSVCFLFSISLFASEPDVIINDNAVSSANAFILSNSAIITKTENPTVGNASEYAAEEADAAEKILVVLVDAYGMQSYSKVVITDVDMELSILIAKDIFDKLSQGVYTVVASSANDLISQKLIIQ